MISCHVLCIAAAQSTQSTTSPNSYFVASGVEVVDYNQLITPCLTHPVQVFKGQTLLFDTAVSQPNM